MKDIGIDDAVIDVWVGNQNNMNVKVKNNNFNACAFFFGGFYFIYRKMYLIGILDLIVTMLMSSGILIFQMASLLRLGDVILWTNLVPIAISIINGFIFYPLYRLHIKNKLQKNVNQNMNPIQVAQLKGGVSSAGVGIAIGISFVIAVVIVILLVGIGMVMFGGMLGDLSDSMNGRGSFNSDYYDYYDYYDDYYNDDYNYDDLWSSFYEKYNNKTFDDTYLNDYSFGI